MPNIFHKCHAYNKVFFYNSNKLAFLSTLYLDPYGAYSFSKFLGSCKIEQLTELPIIDSLINLLSRGFMSFCKIKHKFLE